MANNISKFFTGNIDASRNIFYHDGAYVSMAQFSRDVAHYANIFARVNSCVIILFVPDNIYLFCVCFMAAMQANKNVVLPAMLTEQNAEQLRDLTNVIATNQNINLPGFEYIDLSANFGDEWNFIDMANQNIYFFTSGSTGTPKKIKKTFHNLAVEVSMHTQMQRAKLDLNPVFVSSVLPHHMYGLLWRFLFPLAAGIIADTGVIFTPEELQHAQDKFERILFATTPSFLDSITKYQNQYKFKNNCIGIFTSGSLLNANTSAYALKKFGVSPFEIFGSTETGGVAWRQQENGALWTIFDGVKTSVDKNGCIVADSEFCCTRPYPMSDIVDMQDTNQFLLRGRADRMVKIAEERISLPEYEARLQSHEFIECAVVTPVLQNERSVIGCVLTLNDSGKEFLIQNGRHEFISNLKNYLGNYFPSVALPRRIRIVNAIPMNPQGKILKQDINEILRSSVAEPVMRNLIKTDVSMSGDLVFLSDSAYFKGHFDDFPILPGVIQLHFVIKFIRQFFNIELKQYDVIKLKFSNVILPGTSVHFVLSKLNNYEFAFEYANGDVKYSSGKLVIKD